MTGRATATFIAGIIIGMAIHLARRNDLLRPAAIVLVLACGIGYVMIAAMLRANGFSLWKSLALAPFIFPVIVYEYTVGWPSLIMKNASSIATPPIVVCAVISFLIALFVWAFLYMLDP